MTTEELALNLEGWNGLKFELRKEAAKRLRELDKEIQDLNFVKDFKPHPAFKCELCGEEAFFKGIFSPSRFEQQAREFEKDHRDCSCTFNGGGI